MRREDNMARDLARLEEARRRTQERLAAQQERIEKRFDHVRARISKRYGEPNDSQQRIINAALDLLDQEGLNDLSLRKLAALLDMQAPALYWHFKNKGVLIDYMAEAILQTEFQDVRARSDDEPWQDWLVDVCQRLRRAMHSRRDGARIVAGAHLFPAITLMRIFETTQESLISAGLNPHKADLLATTTVHFTFGRVSLPPVRKNLHVWIWTNWAASSRGSLPVLGRCWKTLPRGTMNSRSHFALLLDIRRNRSLGVRLLVL